MNAAFSRNFRPHWIRIFCGMQLAAWSTKHRCAGINVVVAIIKTSAQIKK
jgi:hypothetical protein